MNVSVFASEVEKYVTPLMVLALLVLDMLALSLGRRERRERLDHMARVEEAARVYSREAYEFLIMRCTQAAKYKIYCYWHSLHIGKFMPRYEAFNNQMIAAHTRDVDVKVITAKDTQRLAAAYELRTGGIEVRFQETLLVSDLRFTLIDDCTLVFGLAESDSKKPSREGVDLTNHKLCALVLRHFHEQWEKAVTYEEYLGAVVTQIRADDSTNTIEMIAQQLGLPAAEISRWENSEQ